MLEVGDVLKRKSAGSGPASLRLVGVIGRDWSATDATEHAEVLRFTTNALRLNYVGADGSDVPFFDEYDTTHAEEHKKKINAAMNKARIVEYETQRDALSPEDVFSMSPEEQAAVREKKSKQIQKRLREAQIGY